ncbi:MAG: ribosome maturation factor RimM [Bacteroidales bacterium]
MFPTLDDLTPIARVHKSYGTEGVVSIVFSSKMENIKLEEPMFIIFDGLLVPFFISDIKYKGNDKAIVKFESVDQLSDADNLSGATLYYLNEALPNENSQDDDFQLSDLIGFEILTSENNSVGIISAVHDFSGNICFEISNTNKSDKNDILIPYHDDMLIDLDIEHKKISLHIPKGLF